jgi:hypothetical protein
MEITLKYLLDLYFELKFLEPDIKNWNENNLSNNQPRYYRLRQLKILFTEFELGSVQEFENGEFIKSRPLEKYNKFLKRADDFILGIHNNSIYNSDIDHKGLIYLFRKFIKYRDILSSASKFNDVIIEVHGIREYS